MAVTNTITSTNLGANNSHLLVKEIDFVSRFQKNWDALIEIMGIARPIKKQAGTQLTVSTAKAVLNTEQVDEGAEVHLSSVSITPIAFEGIDLEKYRKRVTAESVAKYGAAVASQKTDDAFLDELTSSVTTRFYKFVENLVGKTIGEESDFQSAVAMAVYSVKDQFKQMRLNASNIVVFANTLDVGRYLSKASISLQTRNGIEYLKDFMGAQTVIVSSDIPKGHVYAIPADNIVLYYIDPSDSDFEELGLNYTTGHEASNLIGVHKEAVYGRVSGDTHAVMGMRLFAEYANAIADFTITGATV